MSYVYPTIQTVIQGTVFLMTNCIDQTEPLYVIKFRHLGEIIEGRISYDSIIKYTQEGKIKKLKKSNFANNEEFIKIPISLLC